jgi:hypothetical protein
VGCVSLKCWSDSEENITWFYVEVSTSANMKTLACDCKISEDYNLKTYITGVTLTSLAYQITRCYNPDDTNIYSVMMVEIEEDNCGDYNSTYLTCGFAVIWTQFLLRLTIWRNRLIFEKHKINNVKEGVSTLQVMP